MSARGVSGFLRLLAPDLPAVADGLDDVAPRDPNADGLAQRAAVAAPGAGVLMPAYFR
jgi:hypothetical protein